VTTQRIGAQSNGQAGNESPGGLWLPPSAATSRPTRKSVAALAQAHDEIAKIKVAVLGACRKHT
jgi:hypothetical protein